MKSTSTITSNIYVFYLLPAAVLSLKKRGKLQGRAIFLFLSFQINSLQLFKELSNSSLQWGFGNFDLRSIFLSERL